ncbi:MAG: ATPase, T2SS/T4P/T4SS family [bacterium]
MDELFETLIFKALQAKATDIHLKIDQRYLKVYFRVFGTMQFYHQYDQSEGQKLMNYIKYCAHINVNYKLLPQTGAYHYPLNDHMYFLRVSLIPGLNFESIVIRILNNHHRITLENLSQLNYFNSYLEGICDKKAGLFLVAGATGSGKSTTLYAILDRMIEKGGRNIVTLEDPIEMVKDDCLQIEINEQLGIDYETSLKQILRHDPDVILIGEIRDEKTAALAVTCALTGHLVLSTIHASSAALVIKRLLNLGIHRVDLEDVLLGIAAQRIKYDLTHQRVFILPEILMRNDIQILLASDAVNYRTFKDNALTLIREKSYESDLFREELDES